MKAPVLRPTARTEIFRRFVRHHENEREQYGVGLGLYVAKSAILRAWRAHRCGQSQGGGSEFWFELPAPVAELVRREGRWEGRRHEDFAESFWRSRMS